MGFIRGVWLRRLCCRIGLITSALWVVHAGFGLGVLFTCGMCMIGLVYCGAAGIV
jgi:hypothetical protein